MHILKVKKLHPNARMPVRATAQSAGYDLCACLEEPLHLPAGGRVIVPIGIAIAIDSPNVAGFVFGRSGHGARHGICPSNAVGVVDADYRGELLVGLSNHSDTNYFIQPGERIAQLVLLPIFTPELLECAELDETGRGAGGFGSTGR